MIHRRELLRLAGVGLGSLLLGPQRLAARSGSNTPGETRIYQGTNLADWAITVGDAVSVCQPVVTLSDIATIHMSDYSEIRSNVFDRPEVMAHNITFKRFFDEQIFDFMHICEYAFRLPYLPDARNTNFNGQTVEGHLGLWDGQASRLFSSVAYQWVISPYEKTGTLQVWTARGWQAVGFIPVDTNWHTIRLALDPHCKATSLEVDGNLFPSYYVEDQKPGFGTDVSATLAAEAISVSAGPACNEGKQHRVQFKHWMWIWQPLGVCRTFVPLVTRST